MIYVQKYATIQEKERERFFFNINQRLDSLLNYLNSLLNCVKKLNSFHRKLKVYVYVYMFCFFKESTNIRHTILVNFNIFIRH